MIEPRETQDLNLLEDEAFRLHVRSWIEAEYPADLRNPPKRLHWDENKPWYFKMAEKGWLCPGWPREFGGLGLSPAKQIIFTEEIERHGCARTNDHGIVMVGPLLINHGTREQQLRFLPKRRYLCGEWPEDLDHTRHGCQLVLPAGAHGQEREKTGRHFLPAGGYEHARHYREAHHQPGISRRIL